MSGKCTGEKVDCEGDCYIGEGVFVCSFYDSTAPKGKECQSEKTQDKKDLM